MKIDAHVVVAGCARNCASDLPMTLEFIERLRRQFRQSTIIIVENDSDDDTKDVLHAWQAVSAPAKIVCIDGAMREIPDRIDRIAHCATHILTIFVEI